MTIIALLIIFPFIAALVLAFMRKGTPVRKFTLFTFCGLILAGAIYFIIDSLLAGSARSFLPDTHTLDMIMLVIEWLLAILLQFSLQEILLCHIIHLANWAHHLSGAGRAHTSSACSSHLFGQPHHHHVPDHWCSRLSHLCVCHGLHEGLQGAPYGIQRPALFLLCHAVCVLRRHVWTRVLQQPHLDLLLLGDHQHLLVPAHRLQPNTGSHSQLL